MESLLRQLNCNKKCFIGLLFVWFFVACGNPENAPLPTLVPTAPPITQQNLDQENREEDNLMRPAVPATWTPDTNDVVVKEERTPNPVEQKRLPALSLFNSAQTVPNDVLKEVVFFGSGGGDQCTFIPAEGEPYISLAARETRLDIYVCDRQSGEKINVFLTFPDGRQVVEAYGDGFFSYHFEWNDSRGPYQVAIEREQERIEKSFSLRNVPTHPIVDWDIEGTFQFHNFVPGERIRFFVYKSGNSAWQFLNWQEFVVNDKGELSIEIETKDDKHPFDGYAFAATGDESGKATFLDTNLISYFGIAPSIVDPFPVPALVNTEDSLLIIRAEPRSGAAIIAEVDPLTPLNLFPNTRTSDKEKQWWSLIRLDDGTEGWVLDRHVLQVNG